MTKAVLDAQPAFQSANVRPYNYVRVIHSCILALRYSPLLYQKRVKLSKETIFSSRGNWTSWKASLLAFSAHPKEKPFVRRGF